MNTKNKTTAILLAGIMVCSVMAFALPAMAGNTATQSATTAQATTIVLIAQDNTTAVSSWTFTGNPSATNSTPVNSKGDIQVLDTAWKPVVLLNNSASVDYKIILHAAQFNDTNVAQVSDEKYNVTATGEAPANAAAISDALTADTDVDTGVTITADNGQKSLWLKLTFGAAAGKCAESSFSVLGESTQGAEKTMTEMGLEEKLKIKNWAFF